LFVLIGWDVEWGPLPHFLQRQLALPGPHTFVYGAGVEYFERLRDIFGVGTASLHVFNAGFRDYVNRL
jgi:hypothetical protein